jgi:predicted DNA-binding transcriptional regulator YafY
LEYLINDLVRKLGDIKQIDEPIDDAIPAPNERRSPARVRPRPAPEGAPPDAALLDAAIKALRAGEDPKAKPVTPDAAPNKTPASEIAELFREVVDKVISGSTPSEMCITLTYVDTHGMSSNRIVEPIRFEGGLLTGFDLTESRIRDYAISRIAGAEKGKK